MDAFSREYSLRESYALDCSDRVQTVRLGQRLGAVKQEAVFYNITYREKTTYLAQDYLERSRGMLKRFSYDDLANSELAIVNSWLAKINLAELFTS